MDIFSWMLLLVFLLMLAMFSVSVSGVKKIGALEAVQALSPDKFPKVSIVFSALNEEESIANALNSLLELDYPDFEIIAINDRSTDKTGEILASLAKQNQRLRVVHIDALPDGWLGKNHALDVGSQQAEGKFIVFTDADVMFDKSVIKLAVSCCEQQQLDHLTLAPALIAKNHFLQLLLTNVKIGILLATKPWLVASTPNNYTGYGAFNMVKRVTYEAFGRHSAIALNVIDDMALGKLVKDKGYKSQVLTAQETLSVEWYNSPMAMFRGFQKNTFSAFKFRVSNLVMVSVFALFVRLSPWYFLFFGTLTNQMLACATLMTGFFFYYYFLKLARWSSFALLYAPIAVFFELALWWISSLRVLYHKGIVWRGTFYSLNELKERQYPL